VAATLLAGRIEPRSWREFQDPAATDLMRRCSIVPDHELSLASPARCGARISLRMSDGTETHLLQDDFRSMTPADVVARLTRDSAALMSAGHAERVLAFVDGLEHDPAFPNSASLLRGGVL
jgi:2-methylcitrate dehydratase PrpD